MKEGGISKDYKLSKGDVKRLESAGFEWNLSEKVSFDERFKELMAFKAEFGHFNVPLSNSSDNKHLSLGRWCCGVKKAYDIMKEGGISPRFTLSKGDIKRLENAGFEWDPPVRQTLILYHAEPLSSRTCTSDDKKKVDEDIK